jgi:hypothetical protein
VKITIEPDEDARYDERLGIWVRRDGENVPRVVVDDVFQLSICGSRMPQGMFRETFRRNIVANPNELIGLLRAAQEDIRDYKAKPVRACATQEGSSAGD